MITQNKDVKNLKFILCFNFQVFVGIAFCCFRVGVFQRQMDDILDLDFRQYISAPKVYEYINSTQFYFYLLPIIFSVTKTLFVLFLFHVQDEYDKINWVRIVSRRGIYYFF